MYRHNLLRQQFQIAIAQLWQDIHQPLIDSDRRAILSALLPLCKDVPHPASGQTYLRWQILSDVAGKDLTIAKWLESHLDALSILHELGYDALIQQTSDKIWAVWAAEGSTTPVTFHLDSSQSSQYSNANFGWLSQVLSSPSSQVVANQVIAKTGICCGIKTWCSGANVVDYGLMTYRDTDNCSQLVIVDMSQAGIDIDNQGWHAVGMQATDTASIRFDNTPVIAVGNPDDYLNRAGFWHGAAGVAACWYGASIAIAAYLLHSYQQKPHVFKGMYLGQVSSQLSLLPVYFRAVAEQIDTAPSDSHVLMIRQLRQQVVQTAHNVMNLVGEALGSAPFCQSAHFARLMADLAVFIRQTHGAFDAQAIGEKLLSLSHAREQENPWQL